MEDSRIDSLARSLAGARSRRRVVAAAIQAAAALFGVGRIRGALAWSRPCLPGRIVDGMPCGACGVCRNGQCQATGLSCPAVACLRCDVATMSCVTRCRLDQYCAGGVCIDTLPCPVANCPPGQPCACPPGLVCCGGGVCCPDGLCCNGVCGGRSPSDPCCLPGQQACGSLCCPWGQTCCAATGQCQAANEPCCPECTEPVDGACVPTDRFDYCGPDDESRCCQGACMPYNAAYRACHPCEAGTRRCPDSSYGDLGDCCPEEVVCCNGTCCGNPAFQCFQVGSGGNVPHGDYTCDFP